MKKVLVTRAADQAGSFRDALARRGLEPVCLPVIEIVPADDWAACDQALALIDDYEALIFTSANGVRYFVERMARVGRNCDEMPAAFGLGAKTKAAIEDVGLMCVPTADALNANGLAEEICTFMSSAGFKGIKEMRFLFPCGDKAREELPAALRVHGAIVDNVVVYLNRPARAEAAGAVRAMFEARDIACVSLFSPSQVTAFLALFPEFIAAYRATLTVAAIGDTTAAALQTAGIIPDLVSSSPESDIFAAAIAAAL